MCMEQSAIDDASKFSGKKKTNFVIHKGRDRRGDSVVYLISRLPGRTPSEKKIYINIDIDRRAARNDIPILD